MTCSRKIRKKKNQGLIIGRNGEGGEHRPLVVRSARGGSQGPVADTPKELSLGCDIERKEKPTRLARNRGL